VHVVVQEQLADPGSLSAHLPRVGKELVHHLFIEVAPVAPCAAVTRVAGSKVKGLTCYACRIPEIWMPDA
jgi:hypothetical protein